ncbi:unnamed protein product [Lymnaea stagnalis]|uniref:Condensin-2 complex subunit D3 n=1 Tax=Lymnaea stagnalis TaxID=6523 RepID=A0AAV2IMH6_LYMST
MADANKTAAVFESLQLNYFSKEWVKSCWDEDFVDLSTLPDTDRDFLEENGYLTEQLTSAQEILSLWLQANNENENGEGLWIILVESEISHKTLVAILAFLCHNSNKISCSFSERAAGVIAASVYLKLIALPGSAAFQIYNPELFLQACRLLNKWKKSGGQSKGKRKRNETNIKASQKSKKSKGGKQKRVSDEALSQANTDDEHQGSEGEDAVLELDPDELEKLDHLMNLLLQDVLLICEKYSLRQSESTAIQLIGVLLNLAKVDPESMSEAMGQWKRKCSSGILVFKAIYLLCQPFHGHVTVIVNELFREFLEQILILEDGKVFASLNRPLLLIRRHALDFVMYLTKEMGERCVQSLKILLQHICCKVPDRTEYRSHAAEAVIELLDCLPDLDFAQMLEWLKRLSKHKKVTQRGFAVDVILRLLEQPERILSADVPPDLSQFTNHKSMICTILSRCSDVNASVSSRALLGFSSCTNSKHNDIVRTIKEVITPVAEQARPTAKQFMPTPVMSLARLTENHDKENDTIEQTMRNSHTPSDKKNSKTPLGRVSAGYFGAIELTPGFNPYLPDTKGVVSMFHRRILESKVVVRKCAIQALQKVIQLEAPEYRDEDLDALRDRCADPALSVRKQAVQALSELLKAFPEDKRIQKAWVFGILPQVMDRETTVQEKCFDLLEEMILLDMKVATRNSSSGIEWDLLSIITDQNCEKLR